MIVFVNWVQETRSGKTIDMKGFKSLKRISYSRWCKISSDGGSQVDEKTLSEVKEIISKTECPKDFRCYKSGFDVLCKARDIGLDSFLVCLDDDPPDCFFSLTYGTKYFCQCPVRIEIARKLRL